MKFSVTHRDGKARRGALELAHGRVDTPAFMPVGTYGTVKAMSPRELREIDAQMVLVVLMFIGRVGTIAAASACVLRRRVPRYHLPEEQPIIG